MEDRQKWWTGWVTTPDRDFFGFRGGRICGYRPVRGDHIRRRERTRPRTLGGACALRPDLRILAAGEVSAAQVVVLAAAVWCARVAVPAPVALRRGTGVAVVGQSAARWKMTLRKDAARTPLGRVAACALTHVQARGHPAPRRPTNFGPDGNGTPTPRDVRRATAPCARAKTGEACQPCPDRPLGYWDLKPPHSIMALGARAQSRHHTASTGRRLAPVISEWQLGPGNLTHQFTRSRGEVIVDMPLIRICQRLTAAFLRLPYRHALGRVAYLGPAVTICSGYRPPPVSPQCS